MFPKIFPQPAYWLQVDNLNFEGDPIICQRNIEALIEFKFVVDDLFCGHLPRFARNPDKNWIKVRKIYNLFHFYEKFAPSIPISVI